MKKNVLRYVYMVGGSLLVYVGSYYLTQWLVKRDIL